MFILSCNSTTNKPVDRQGTESTETTLADAKYTCPMHPEVTSDKSGDCPKCGMALVEVDTASVPLMDSL